MDMEMWILAIVILLIAVVLGFVIGTVVVFLQNREKDTEDPYSELTVPVVYSPRWVVELWDINRDVCYRTAFDGRLTLGRGNPKREIWGFLAIGDDATLSREQCILYVKGNQILACNLSKINATLLNGVAIYEPAVIQIGDRLTMGGRTFEISDLHAGTQ